MKIAIVGSRDFNDYSVVDEFVCSKLDLSGVDTVVSGGARGVDKLAEKFADKHGLDMSIRKADWERYGRSAGPRRNKLIVEEADAVFAFPSQTSKGTWHTINLARKAGKLVHVCEVKINT